MRITHTGNQGPDFFTLNAKFPFLSSAVGAGPRGASAGAETLQPPHRISGGKRENRSRKIHPGNTVSVYRVVCVCVSVCLNSHEVCGELCLFVRG